VKVSRGNVRKGGKVTKGWKTLTQRKAWSGEGGDGKRSEALQCKTGTLERVKKKRKGKVDLREEGTTQTQTAPASYEEKNVVGCTPRRGPP